MRIPNQSFKVQLDIFVLGVRHPKCAIQVVYLVYELLFAICILHLNFWLRKISPSFLAVFECIVYYRSLSQTRSGIDENT